MLTSDFDYHLPQHLIAQSPAQPRDSSRLLLLNRHTGAIQHSHFRNLPDHLREGDLLVLNDSRVVPARLLGRRAATGGRVELMLLHRLDGDTWKSLGRPSRALRPSAEVVIEGASGDAGTAKVLERWSDGTCAVELHPEDAVLAAGHTPLPPYIHQLPVDPDDYQTVYALNDGSAAAPTAGLHFTQPLLEGLTHRGIRLAYVTLHVGADTFRPVGEESPEKHELHGEYFQLSERTAAELNAARNEGRRIVTVGTTSTRVLEQVAQLPQSASNDGSPSGPIAIGPTAIGPTAIGPTEGWAHIYILPGHTFRLTDGMITNFHLPRTTLLMMISAFAGRDLVLRAYAEAITQEYRFYSFGDAMLIV